MSPLMNRLAELLGFDLAQRLAAEFGGQTIYFPLGDAAREQLCRSGRVVDCGNGFLTLERTPEEAAAVDAAILAEFNGVNHAELAHSYRVSLHRVYHLVKLVQHEALAAAIRATGGSSSAEVAWVSPLTQLGRPSALAAALRAIEKATAQGRFDQLVIALGFLQPEPAAALHETGQPGPTAPAESLPGTPAPADSSPTR